MQGLCPLQGAWPHRLSNMKRTSHQNHPRLKTSRLNKNTVAVEAAEGDEEGAVRVGEGRVAEGEDEAGISGRWEFSSIRFDFTYAIQLDDKIILIRY